VKFYSVAEVSHILFRPRTKNLIRPFGFDSRLKTFVNLLYTFACYNMWLPGFPLLLVDNRNFSHPIYLSLAIYHEPLLEVSFDFGAVHVYNSGNNHIINGLVVVIFCTVFFSKSFFSNITFGEINRK
jgi:hypothetical protein